MRWVKQQGVKILTCSMVMPNWSDGEGNGPVHRKLSELLVDGTHPGDMLFFSCAGRRAWSGTYSPGADGFHLWTDKSVLNPISPWSKDRVSLEMSWFDPGARYAIEVLDPPADPFPTARFGFAPGGL